MEERNISWMCARRDTYRMVSLYLLSSVRHLFPSVIHPNLTHAQINKRYSRSIGRRLATVVQRPIKMQLDNVENKYRIETMKKTVSWLNGKWKMRQTCPIIRNGIWCVDFDFDGVQILHLIQQQCTLATVVISHMQRHSHSLRAQPALSPPILPCVDCSSEWPLLHYKHNINGATRWFRWKFVHHTNHKFSTNFSIDSITE